MASKNPGGRPRKIKSPAEAAGIALLRANAARAELWPKDHGELIFGAGVEVAPMPGTRGAERKLCDHIESNLGSLFVALGIPAPDHWRRELKISGGRLDFMVWSEDGSSTILEVKARSKGRNAASDQQRFSYGVGQLLAYGLRYDNVRLVLVTDVHAVLAAKTVARYRLPVRVATVGAIFGGVVH